MSRPSPSPGPRPEFRFPEIERYELDNGLPIFAVRNHRNPLVAIRLIVDAGSQFDAIPGLASFHAALLDEGTEQRTSLQIASEVERLGGSLGTGAGWDAASLSVRSLSTHLQHSLELLAEVARSPTFPSHEVERERSRRTAEILRRQNEPGAIAGRLFSQNVFAETQYETPSIGDQESVESISRSHLREFYRRYFGSDRAALVAVGDFDAEQLVHQAESAFGNWGSAQETQPPFHSFELEPPEPEEIRILIADRPEGVQTQLLLGHVGVARSTPDFPALRLLNAMLGGKFISRINLNLRERNGYTYGAHSSFSCRRGSGSFTVSTAVANDVAGAACREILNEVDGMRSGSPPQTELDDAREYLVGVFPYTVQTLGDVAGRLEDLAVYRLPGDTFETWTEELDRVTADDIGDLARRVLRPRQIVVVAVGPAAELEPQLSELGPTTVVDER